MDKFLSAVTGALMKGLKKYMFPLSVGLLNFTRHGIGLIVEKEYSDVVKQNADDAYDAIYGDLKPIEDPQIHDNPEITDEEKLRTSVCISVPENTEVGGEVGVVGVVLGYGEDILLLFGVGAGAVEEVLVLGCDASVLLLC